ncbi:MAG: hypothetical protein HZB35_04425 [Nitrospirae bacterium]|nr:hypothetical protein [Nitrospirota bacterium]
MWRSFGNPDCALKIGIQGAVWVEAHRGITGRVNPRYHMVDLPTGAIRPSPMEPNIVEMDVVEARLRELILPESGGVLLQRLGVPALLRPMCLVLPDLAVRVGLLAVDAFPDRFVEQEALVRWRLEQERLFPMAGTRVAFQTFGQHSKKQKAPQTVLAVVIRDTILSQYDQLCERLGLSVVDLDISTFRLWNLWIRGAGRAESQQPDSGIVWLNLLDGGFTIAVFQSGAPVFFRNKPLPSGRASEPRPRIRTEYVVNELTSSLLYCQEQHPKLAPKRLVLVGHDLPPALSKDILQACQLEVSELGWDTAESLGWSQAFDHSPLELLEAVAGLAGAA